jgi:uncharacterized protein YndB with AHSA1/START domain
MSDSATATLVVRRIIKATPERVFEAWTNPEQIKKWWGTESISCPDAEVDLRAGGRYRVANQLPDGRVVWISGEFEVVEPPHKLVYTWRMGSDGQDSERVTVRFEPREGATEVIIVHERIPNQKTREAHENGWYGCLDGLVEFLGG